MLIQQDNVQSAVYFLLGLQEGDVNAVFKEYAKDWLKALRVEFRQWQTRYSARENSAIQQAQGQTMLKSIVSNANLLANSLTFDAKERLLMHLAAERKW